MVASIGKTKLYLVSPSLSLFLIFQVPFFAEALHSQKYVHSIVLAFDDSKFCICIILYVNVFMIMYDIVI